MRKGNRKRVLAVLLAVILGFPAFVPPQVVWATEVTQEQAVDAVATEEPAVTPDETVEEATVIPETEEAVTEAAPTERTYVHDGYTVAYSVSVGWGTSYNGNVVVSNTGGEAITRWKLTFVLMDTVSGFVWEIMGP